MNIPISWLRDYVRIDCDTKTFVNKMTMSGSKVEAVHIQAGGIAGVVAGKVLSVERHGNADTLFVTKVDVGERGVLQIVTGAENLYAGAVVPVALDGAVLADGSVIKKGSLRGEMSDGMLCSVEELGFTRWDYPEAPEHGIYIFPEGADDCPLPRLGDDAAEALGMRDEVIEFELTSNRVDCYSVTGIAREAAAVLGEGFNHPAPSGHPSCRGEYGGEPCGITVEILNPELCPRYIARAVKNVRVAPSPLWMRRRLTAAGIRPINNIVDITNYVMYELGQPMHAFDIENVAEGGIIVRNASEGEVFTTLDGVERKLDTSMLVIADKLKALAIAGVMGGENSKVTDGAAAVLFESANFNGTNIRLTSKKLGLRTDASGRFEKGLDPNLAETAVNRACRLVEILGCGEVVDGMADCYPQKREPWTVGFDADSINRLLGTDIDADTMGGLLRSVGIKADINGRRGVAEIPTFRSDITMEADIAEEVARLYGYDLITETLAAGTPTVGRLTDWQTFCSTVRETMTAQGFYEALTYAFESPKVFDKLNLPEDSPLRKTVRIINPLGEDYGVMRTLTLNGMLTSLSLNYNRRNDEALLFEIGKEYIPNEDTAGFPSEVNVLTIGAYGGVDFYGMKGVVEELFDTVGVFGADYVPTADFTATHPGRTSVVMLNGEDLGIIGEVHPVTAENYKIGVKAYVAVISLDQVFKHIQTSRVYKPVPKFPAVKRDIAVVVKEGLLVKDMERAIYAAGGGLTENVALFDVYCGKGVEEGHKSVAYSVVFRASDRTLTDKEVGESYNNIVKELENKFSARLRT